MNEKRKSEGELVQSLISNEQSVAKRLLTKCKADEHARNLMAIPFGKGTFYLVPAGIDVDLWKERKREKLATFSG